MKISLFLVAAVTASCMLGQVAGAEEEYQVYYYSGDNEMSLASRSLWFVGEFTDEQIAVVLFTNLIDNNASGRAGLVPEGTRLISVELSNNCLTVNLSREFLNYGGAAHERLLVRQFAKTANSIARIERLSILIDYCSTPLSEGMHILETDLAELLANDDGDDI